MKKFPTFLDRILSSVFVGASCIVALSIIGFVIYCDFQFIIWFIDFLKWDRELGAIMVICLMIIQLIMAIVFFEPINLREEPKKISTNK